MSIKVVVDSDFLERAPNILRELVDKIDDTELEVVIVLGWMWSEVHHKSMHPELPTLTVSFGREIAVVGPLHLAYKSVCQGCLRHWTRTTEPTPLTTWTIDSPAVWAVAEIINGVLSSFKVGGNLPEALTALAVGYRTLTRTRHSIYPLSSCPRCTEINRRLPPDTRIHCSAATGIVNSLELNRVPIAGCYRATAYWSSPLPVAGKRPLLKIQTSFGRGRTLQDAELGCIGEALERYSLIYRGDERLVKATIAQVDAVHPDSIQLFSDLQYLTRQEWNSQAADDCLEIFERFDPFNPIEWIEAKPLCRDDTSKFVPAACCLMWYGFKKGELEFARADTVGCGCALDFEDALIHALLEWIERDAMAIWWENRLPRPALRVESFESQELEAVAAGLASINRELYMLDCTTDIGIPAYVAVAPRIDGTEPLLGAAAHPVPAVAAWAAASEAGQVWYEAKRSGTLPTSLRNWLLNETCSTQPYLVPASLTDSPNLEPVAKRDILDYITYRLRVADLHPYVVDHSRSDVLPKTARAVVPGMRHIWNRRAPGRLYDVPVRMGWLKQAFHEEQLNPVRCTI